MQKVANDSFPASGRSRLMATARELFTRRGASHVGINDVTDSAGVARMTLYNNFASKDALVLAVYEELIETTWGALRGIGTAKHSEEQRILAVFDYFEGKAHQADYRGCPFIHASLQAAETSGPLYTLVHSYKRALRHYVLSLLDEDRKNRPVLADQIILLLDGAVTESYLKGVEQPAIAAKRAVATLLKFTE